MTSLSLLAGRTVAIDKKLDLWILTNSTVFFLFMSANWLATKLSHLSLTSSDKSKTRKIHFYGNSFLQNGPWCKKTCVGGGGANNKGTDHLYICAVCSAPLLFAHVHGGGGGGGGGGVANTKCTDHLHICAVWSAFLLFAHVHVRLW